MKEIADLLQVRARTAAFHKYTIVEAIVCNCLHVSRKVSDGSGFKSGD